MLHIKINLLRKEQLGFFINDGVINYLIPELNRLYNYNFNIDTIPDWQLHCFNIVQNDYESYQWMINEWCKLIGYPNYNWKDL